MIIIHTLKGKKIKKREVLHNSLNYYFVADWSNGHYNLWVSQKKERSENAEMIIKIQFAEEAMKLRNFWQHCKRQAVCKFLANHFNSLD